MTALADKLQFELVSPEEQLTSGHCDMVVMPGEEGDLGILSEHAPIVTLLRPGVVAVYRDDKIDERFFVSGGFAEVNPRGCIVLTEEGLDLATVTPDAAAQRLDTARRDLADIEVDGPAMQRATKAVRIAEALVEAVEG